MPNHDITGNIIDKLELVVAHYMARFLLEHNSLAIQIMKIKNFSG